MVKHMIIWRLKDGIDKDARAKEIKVLLIKLAPHREIL